MPDSLQNGHHEEVPTHPVVRPALGERAGRGLTALEPESQAELHEEAEAAPFESELERSELERLAPLGENGGGVPPTPPLDLTSSSNFGGNPGTPNDKELGLMEHLGELRVRLLWCFAAVGIAMMLTWNRCAQISDWIVAPIKLALVARPGNHLVSIDPTGFFTIYLQISVVSALIVTMPFLLFQVWRFIEPALTNNERRYTLVLVPFSSVLFFLGVGLGYWMSPMFFQFFVAFQPKDVVASWDYGQSAVILAKTLLVFGLAFQVPVITIFLNKTGIVSRNMLIQYWRHAIVVIFSVIAVVTPTWDPLTMTVCAIPPCLLYLLSIWLVKWL